MHIYVIRLNTNIRGSLKYSPARSSHSDAHSPIMYAMHKELTINLLLLYPKMDAVRQGPPDF